MAERITGRIFLLNEEGDCDRDINVLSGNSQTIEGTYGSLIVDMTIEPPKIQGKGNVWINSEGCIRTTRIKSGENLNIAISSDGKKMTSIGDIKRTTLDIV
jgi:hypothetical protein